MSGVLLRIGELSAKTGLGQRAIHYYESLGLIRPVQREGAGYRYYNENTVARIEKIQVLKKMGLSLEEIASVIDAYFENTTMMKGKKKVLVILKNHLASLDAQLSELASHRLDLEAHIARLQSIINSGHAQERL